MATYFDVILFSLIGGLFSLIGGVLLLSSKRIANKLACMRHRLLPVRYSQQYF